MFMDACGFPSDSHSQINATNKLIHTQELYLGRYTGFEYDL
jgi:hypothetical protein